MARSKSAVTLQVTLGGLVGSILAEDKALATLPVTCVVTGMALSTIPASMLMRRVGRRLGFMAGALLAICGSLLSAPGVYQGSFWLFCLGEHGRASCRERGCRYVVISVVAVSLIKKQEC